jgi:sarcosine oxidase
LWDGFVEKFDVAVVGLGAAGSAALWQLARSGARVIGIDQYAPGHDRGSSHGETRLLRTAYSEGDFYVPLVRRAIRLWRALEKESGKTLFEQTGVAYAGAKDDPFIAEALATAERSGVKITALRDLDTWFDLPRDWVRLNDRAGGYLYPERCIAAFLRSAKSRGAIVQRARCKKIETDGEGIVLQTTRGKINAGRVVIATGAWIKQLVPELTSTFVERRVLHWFADPKRLHSRKNGFRPFAIAPGGGQLVYGFPANAKGEVKVAEHHTVQIIDGPEALNRRVSRADTALIDEQVHTLLPHLGKRVRSKVCMYPMATDERFILDRHPRDPRIVIGAGLSGHGFKFAPAIGEVLANLAMEGAQKLPVEAFAMHKRWRR